MLTNTPNKPVALKPIANLYMVAGAVGSHGRLAERIGITIAGGHRQSIHHHHLSK